MIVRSGCFGVKYDILEYQDITSTSVSVGFLDKSSKTGSLQFASPSVHAGKPITFGFIERPYETMKEIKEYMSSIENS